MGFNGITRKIFEIFNAIVDESRADASVSVEDTSELAGQSAAELELVEFFKMNESSFVCRRLVSLVVDAEPAL